MCIRDDDGTSITVPCSSGRSKRHNSEPTAVETLALALKMENLAKQINNDRLRDLIEETEKVIANVQDEGALSMDELSKLKGGLYECIDFFYKSTINVCTIVSYVFINFRMSQRLAAIKIRQL